MTYLLSPISLCPCGDKHAASNVHANVAQQAQKHAGPHQGLTLHAPCAATYHMSCTCMKVHATSAVHASIFSWGGSLESLLATIVPVGIDRVKVCCADQGGL